MIKDFVRNIILIIEDDKVLDIGISLKKKNYEKNIDQKLLENSLVEIKDIFNENYQDLIIMHMIIVEKENTFLLNNTNNNDDYLFLEVNFISVSNNFTFYFNKLLENHQIKIKRYMSGGYIKSFFDKDATELSLMANKLNDGLNKNEVQLVLKSMKIKVFLKNFFNYLAKSVFSSNICCFQNY
jgi:hypothetical protein